MKRTRNILLALLGVVLLSLLVYSFSSVREPEYQQQSMSWWFDKIQLPPASLADHTRAIPELYAPPPYRADKNTQAAFRHFGSASVPFLPPKLTETPSSTKRKVLTFLATRLGVPVRQRLPGEERQKALWLLRFLGPDATPAIPALLELFQTSEDDQLRGNIARVLEAIGSGASNAVPVLMHAATNDPAAGIRAVSCLVLPRMTHTHAEIQPCLERSLYDSSWIVCEAAADSLVKINALSPKEVPRLLSILSQQPRFAYTPMLGALIKADPAATFDFFRARCDAPAPSTRAEAIRVLAQFKDRRTQVLPILIQNIPNTNHLVRSVVLGALPGIALGNDEAIGALLKESVTAEGLAKEEILRTLKQLQKSDLLNFQLGPRPQKSKDGSW